MTGQTGVDSPVNKNHENERRPGGMAPIAARPQRRVDSGKFRIHLLNRTHLLVDIDDGVHRFTPGYKLLVYRSVACTRTRECTYIGIV